MTYKKAVNKETGETTFIRYEDDFDIILVKQQDDQFWKMIIKQKDTGEILRIKNIDGLDRAKDLLHQEK